MADFEAAHLPFPSDLLSLVIPTSLHTYLLRACLHDGEKGLSSWEQWLANVEDPKQALKNPLQSSRDILPMLYQSVRKNNWAVDRELLPYLKTAYFHEELRSKTFCRILKKVLTSFEQAKIPCILLKGASLIEDIYELPSLRHCHDINLLFKNNQDKIKGAEIMMDQDFTLAGRLHRRTEQSVILRHESLLPVVLQTHIPGGRATWQRAAKKMITDVPVHTLSPTDALVHTLSNVPYYHGRGAKRWVCDIWLLVAQQEKIDWPLFLDLIVRCRLTLQARIVFQYLIEEIDIDIKPDFVNRLTLFSGSLSLTEKYKTMVWLSIGDHVSTRQAIAKCKTFQEKILVIVCSLLTKTASVRNTTEK